MQLFGKEWIVVNEEVAIYLSFLIVITILINNLGGTVITSFTEQKGYQYNGSLIYLLFDPNMALYVAAGLTVYIIYISLSKIEIIKERVSNWIKNEFFLLDFSSLLGLLLLMAIFSFNELNDFFYIALYSAMFPLAILHVFTLKDLIVFKESKNYQTIIFMISILALFLFFRIYKLIGFQYPCISFVERVILPIIFVLFFSRVILINNFHSFEIPFVHNVRLTSLILFIWMRLFFFEKILTLNYLMKVIITLPLVYIYILFIRHCYILLLEFMLHIKKDFVSENKRPIGNFLSNMYYYITVAFFYLRKMDKNPLNMLLVLCIIVIIFNYANIDHLLIWNMYLLVVFIYIRIGVSFVLVTPGIYESVCKRAEEKDSAHIVYMLESLHKAGEFVAEKSAEVAKKTAPIILGKVSDAGVPKATDDPFNKVQPPFACDDKLIAINKETTGSADKGSDKGGSNNNDKGSEDGGNKKKDFDVCGDVIKPFVAVVGTLAGTKIISDQQRISTLEQQQAAEKKEKFNITDEKWKIKQEIAKEKNPEAKAAMEGRMQNIDDRCGQLDHSMAHRSQEMKSFKVSSIVPDTETVFDP